MDEKIFIPNTIRVGYQERSDTYTGRLAYVIYYDAKNKIRKEASWSSWRDDKIEANDFENVPISGFVLNKKVGDYAGRDWYDFHRSAHCRVYDPRGFEFEISIENLLYILENATSTKGKGLEGEFVYGWYGSDLILLPVESPDYQKMKAYTDMISKPEKIVGATMVIGGTYRTSQNEDWVYLGRYVAYETRGYGKKKLGENLGLHHYFYKGTSFMYIKSMSGRIVKVVNPEPVDGIEYARMMDELETKEFYSPYNPEADVYDLLTPEEIERLAIEKNYWGYNHYGVYMVVDGDYCGKITVRSRARDGEGAGDWMLDISSYYWSYDKRYNSDKWENRLYREYEKFVNEYGKKWFTLDELCSAFNFYNRRKFLMNGKEYNGYN